MAGLPEINPTGLAPWLAMFLRTLRSEWQRKVVGVNGGLDKIVTFKDLVALGLVSEGEAEKQAGSK
jgi:hypothetical protein